MKLTLEKVHAMVEKAIEEKGKDYVYPNAGGSCSYVDYKYTDMDGTCERGCIVGHIFIDGLNLDMLDIVHSPINEESASAFISYLVRRGEIDLPDDGGERIEIHDYLNALQQSQDNGRTWGESHEKAKLGFAWNKYSKDWELFT